MKETKTYELRPSVTLETNNDIRLSCGCIVSTPIGISRVVECGFIVIELDYDTPRAERTHFATNELLNEDHWTKIQQI